MTSQGFRVVLAIDKPELRERVSAALARENLSQCILASANELRWFPLAEDDFILLQTNDDIAKLMQIVYKLYKRLEANDTLPIMAYASAEAVRRNPAIAFWLIDNHAALICLVGTEDIGFERLPTIIKRLAAH